MKTKLSLLAAALLFAFTTIQAENEITIGAIQYDLSDIDKSFKDLQRLVWFRQKKEQKR